MSTNPFRPFPVTKQRDNLMFSIFPAWWISSNNLTIRSWKTPPSPAIMNFFPTLNRSRSNNKSTQSVRNFQLPFPAKVSHGRLLPTTLAVQSFKSLQTLDEKLSISHNFAAETFPFPHKQLLESFNFRNENNKFDYFSNCQNIINNSWLSLANSLCQLFSHILFHFSPTHSASNHVRVIQLLERSTVSNFVLMIQLSFRFRFLFLSSSLLSLSCHGWNYPYFGFHVIITRRSDEKRAPNSPELSKINGATALASALEIFH